MGNTFSYYQGNNQFVIDGPDTIFAAAILESNIRIADITMDDDFEGYEEYNTTTGKSTILIRYKPSDTYTADVLTNRLALTINTGELDSGLSVDWVVSTSNTGISGQTSNTEVSSSTSPVFTSPYNTSTITVSVGSGGGDPHICPLFNPSKKTYILPTDNLIYKYFDNLDSLDRLAINAKMWVLSNTEIAKVERLQRQNDPSYESEAKNLVNHINDQSINVIDTSFVRYLSIIYQTETCDEIIVIDMEKFAQADHRIDNFDEKMQTYKLPIIETLKTKHIDIGEVCDNTYNLNYHSGVHFPTRDGSKKMEIKVTTEKHGVIIIRLIPRV